MNTPRTPRKLLPLAILNLLLYPSQTVTADSGAVPPSRFAYPTDKSRGGAFEASAGVKLNGYGGEVKAGSDGDNKVTGSGKLKTPVGTSEIEASQERGKKTEYQTGGTLGKEGDRASVGIKCDAAGKNCEKSQTLGGDLGVVKGTYQERQVEDYPTSKAEYDRYKDAHNKPYNPKDQPVKTRQDCTSLEGGALGVTVTGERCSVKQNIGAAEAKLCEEDPQHCIKPGGTGSLEYGVSAEKNAVPGKLSKTTGLSAKVGGEYKHKDRYNTSQEEYDAESQREFEQLRDMPPGAMSRDKGLYRTQEDTLGASAELGYKKKYNGNEVEVTAAKFKGQLPSTEYVRTPQRDALDRIDDMRRGQATLERERGSYPATDTDRFADMEGSYLHKKASRANSFQAAKQQNDYAAAINRQSSAPQSASSSGASSVLSGAAQALMPILGGVLGGVVANSPSQSSSSTGATGDSYNLWDHPPNIAPFTPSSTSTPTSSPNPSPDTYECCSSCQGPSCGIV